MFLVRVSIISGKQVMGFVKTVLLNLRRKRISLVKIMNDTDERIPIPMLIKMLITWVRAFRCF